MRNRTRQSDRSAARPGFASVMAMLYLVLFATLAIGFYAGTTLSVQVAKNDRALTISQIAAESGMRFMRLQLGAITVPPGTTNDALLATVYGLLSTKMNGTSNMGTDTVGMSGSTIAVPSQAGNYIMLDNSTGARFRATVTSSGEFLIVTVWGRGNDANISRALQLSYDKAPRASAIFNYGVVSKGPVTMSGNVTITGATDPAKGSLLSATSSASPLTMSGSGSISGDFSFTNPAAAPSYGTGTIAGLKSNDSGFDSHIHAGVTPPIFPTIDAASYAQYATGTFPGSTDNVTLTNVTIPANTNPSFTGNVTIQGVLYIQTPNKVSFGGNTTVQGAIIVENNPQGTGNTLNFSGGVQASSISTLPTTFPAGERALTGAMILAPSFAVSFGGNFGTIGGSLIADQFNFSGNAGGTVQGSVISLKDVPMTLGGNSDITIASTGTSNYPTGVSFGSYYTPLLDTYVEVMP